MTGDTIIKAEDLGKQFILSHERSEKYTALRDVISRTAKSIVKKKTELPSKEEFWALKDVNFEIKKGETVGIIGRNGAGKSTLLKVLSRITGPTKGRITIDGRIASLLEVGTGFHPELTGRENIFLNGAILGMSRSEIKSKFDEIIDFSGVGKFLDTPVKHYSSGMYVRLAFAVAAHLEPEILVIDEILAVGDAEFQQKCLGKMDEVSKQGGRTVLFVSHQLGMIAQLCRTCMWLHEGKVQAMGNTNQVIDEYLSHTHTENPTYIAPVSKKNYIRRIDIVNTKLESCNLFTHKDEIIFRIECHVKDWNRSIGITMNVMDRNKKHIFSIEEPLSNYVYDASDPFVLLVKIPSHFLTPKTYTLNCGIQIPGQLMFDHVKDACPFRIIDAGTEFALYEGVDYGSVFAKYNIELAVV